MRKAISNQQSAISKRFGFTLVELLVVVSIIGVLVALSLVALSAARASGRDTKRKTDLEQVRSGLELYYSDCGKYPSVLGSSLSGDGSSSTCQAGNTYISKTPSDPSVGRTYSYSASASPTRSYILCAALEQNPGTDSSGCGSCTVTCNYKVTNP